MIFTVGLSVAIRMSLRWSATELERREAVKSRTEAELKNLRNQLNPHFLLNTLNNIYALTAFDTEKHSKPSKSSVNCCVMFCMTIKKHLFP